MADVRVSRAIAAPPERVWELVSDMTRMGKWSPEATGGKWLGGATGPSAGARFRGTNKAGWQRWSTTCEVVDCVPGERFTFAVTIGPVKVATWSYEIEPTDSGCRVTESWTDQRSSFFAGASRRVTRVQDRAQHNRANMDRTLEALERAATA
jgi:uncharacterized protein YndB with AHSA1/START domain